ncbi:MAG: hypothetical protein ACR2O1_02840 [Boseongicola sp.]
MTIITPDARLLSEIAPMMADIGAQQCGDGCREYHRAWGYLRLFAALPAVGRDHEVLLTTLRAQIQQDRRRILISGAADAGILAYVIEAFRLEGATGKITVVDTCGTPLSINSWYGTRSGWPIETWCGPIQDFDGRGFDVVVSHNFLNSIAPEDRRAVCTAWRGALDEGGRAVFIAQLKPDKPLYGRRFDDKQVSVLVNDYLQARAKSDHRELITSAALEKIVRSFAETRYSHRLQTLEQIAAPLEDSGFRNLEIADIGTSLPISQAVGSTRRVSVVAEKVD